MKRGIALILIGLLIMITAPVLAEEAEEKYIKIIKDKVNIRMGSSTSTVIIAQAQKGDIFELKGEEEGWYKINMFSGEYRYVYKSLANPVTYNISLPSSVSVRQKIFDLLGETEDRAMHEADQKYPMNISGNIYKNIDYERLLIDRYKLEIFHKYKIQPVIYRKLIIERIEAAGYF